MDRVLTYDPLGNPNAFDADDTPSALCMSVPSRK
jgi:hypothetical protein